MSDMQGTSIPDDIFDRHFGGTEEADTVGDETGIILNDDADLTVEGDTDDLEAPGDGLGDLESDADDGTGDDGALGEEADESEESEGDRDDASHEEDDPFDRKEIDAITDPKARAVAEKAYKSLVRDYTRKTQEVAELRKSAEREVSTARAFQTEYEQFMADLATPAGGEHFLLTVADAKPELFTETVLVDLGLRNPELLAAALDRVQELSDDPRARRVFDGERSIAMQNHREGQTRATQQRVSEQRVAETVRRLVQDEAGKLGVRKAESIEIVQDSVDNFLRRAAAAGTKVVAADVRAHAAKVAKRLAGERRDAAKAQQAADRRAQQERVRRTAKMAGARRTTPPNTAAPGGRKAEWVRPKRENDVIDSMVDRFFGD
jgi:hypothetical protein